MTSFKPRFLPKTLPPNTIILGIGASIFESGEDTHLVHNNIHHVTCVYIYYTYICILIYWRRKWQPTAVLLPGKSHGQRSLLGYSPWGHKELDMTKWLHFTHFTHFILYPWRRKWQPTPVFLPGESHGKRTLAGHGPWGHRELDTTEVTEHMHTYLYMGFPGSSIDEESTFNAGDPSSIPGSGRSPGEGTGSPLGFCSILGLPWWLRGKESACNVGDLGLIPVMGRYPGGGHGKPTQYSCLGNSHSQKSGWVTVRWATKSQTQLSS